MVICVATFDVKPAFHTDEAMITKFRDWMKSQPGFHSAWHASDSRTGKAMSISVWQDMASVMAMKDRQFPGGPLGAKPASVMVYDEVDGF